MSHTVATSTDSVTCDCDCDGWSTTDNRANVWRQVERLRDQQVRGSRQVTRGGEESDGKLVPEQVNYAGLSSHFGEDTALACHGSQSGLLMTSLSVEPVKCLISEICPKMCREAS